MGVLRLAENIEFAPRWSAAEYGRIVVPQGAGGPMRCLFVACEGAMLAGFAVGLVVGDEAELESVAVRADLRRQGVGAELCRAVMGWCAEQGAAEMHLEVRAGSLGVIRLYERLGFMESGRRRGYYERPNDDAVLMHCGLPGGRERV